MIMNPKIEKALDYVEKIENIIDKLSYESTFSDDFIEEVGNMLSDLKEKLESSEDEFQDQEDSDEE